MSEAGSSLRSTEPAVDGGPTPDQEGEQEPRPRPAFRGLAGWQAVSLVMAASLLPHLGALWPGLSYYFRDFSVTFYPLRLFQARELAEGRWPFWNPYIHEGAFALPVLYPIDLLHALWPGPAAVSWLLTLHFPLAALALYLLAREMGMSRAASVWAGAIYSLAGLAVSTLNLYVFLQALAWAPLVGLTLRRAALRGARWMATAALVLAVSLTTLAVEFVGQAVLLGLALGWAARPGLRSLSRMAAAVVLALGLAAVPVAVTAGLMSETVRGSGFAREVALANELHPMTLLQVLVPNLFGSLSSPVELWWGGAFFSKGFPYFLSLYLGAVPLALAAVGWPALSARTRWALATCALAALWYALGARGGLAPLLAPLPVFRWFRFPVKALLLPHLAVTLLAAGGFDRLRAGQGWARSARWLAGLAALAALPAVAVLVAGRTVESAAGVPSWAHGRVVATSLGACLTAAVAALLSAAAHGRRTPPARAVGLLAVLAGAELARAASGMNPQVPERFFEPLPEMAALRLSDAGRVFSYGPDASPAFRRFLHSRPEGMGLWSFFVNRQVLGPYNNILDRVETPEAKDLTSFVPRPAALLTQDYDPAAVAGILDRLRNAAVAHVLSLDPLSHPDLRPLAVVPSGPPGLDIHVYRLERTWPRAYVACRVLLVPSREAALEAPFQTGMDPRGDAALEVTASGPPGAAHPSCRMGTASRRHLPGRETYDVTLDGAGWLVARESHARGWQAWVDGQPAPVVRANGKHRAVPVPAGRHEVRFLYRPPGLPLGALAMALAGMVTLSLFLVPGGGGRADDEARPAEAPPSSPTPGAAGPLRLLCPSCRHDLAPAGEEWRCRDCGSSYVERDGIVHLVAGWEGQPGYDPHYFDTLPDAESRHFWFLARREVIFDAIRVGVPDWRERPLFDIGCGTGGLLEFLARMGVPVAGACDAYLRALQATREKVKAPLVLVDENGTPPLAPGLAAMGMFDVLEHIDDDRGTLAWALSVLQPGGTLILTVPAHPFLFGEMDRLAHHRRRYRRRELRDKLQEAGFELVRLTHFMAPMVPLLALTRTLRRLGAGRGGALDKDAELRVVPVLNAILRAVLRLERLWLRLASLPFGSSLLAVARRPNLAAERPA